MLSPFPGYIVWKDYEIDTKQCFIFPKIYFLTIDFIFVSGPPIVCMITIWIQDLKYFFRSDPHVGFFVLIYWCDCAVQSFLF